MVHRFCTSNGTDSSAAQQGIATGAVSAVRTASSLLPSYNIVPNHSVVSVTKLSSSPRGSRTANDHNHNPRYITHLLIWNNLTTPESGRVPHLCSKRSSPPPPFAIGAPEFEAKKHGCHRTHVRGRRTRNSDGAVLGHTGRRQAEKNSFASRTPDFNFMRGCACARRRWSAGNPWPEFVLPAFACFIQLHSIRWQQGNCGGVCSRPPTGTPSCHVC